MKRSLILTFLLLLLTFGVAIAQPYNDDVQVTKIGTSPLWYPSGTLGTVSTDTIIPIGTNGEYPCRVAWENSDLIQGATAGIWVHATGDVGAKFIYDTIQLTPYPIFDGGSVLPSTRGTIGIDWKFTVFGLDSDTALAGGAWSPPDKPGIPTGPLEDFYVHRLFIIAGSGDPGQICFDSVPKAGPGGVWKFDFGGGNIVFPTFNNNTGEICFNYDIVPCLSPQFTTTPPDDELIADHCAGTTFQFAADPREPGKIITGYTVVDNGGLDCEITNGGLFTAHPDDPGDYEVTVSVSNDCPASKSYTFTVSLTNAGIAINCPTATQGGVPGLITVPLNAHSLDCDGINWTITTTSGTPTNAPELNSAGNFVWTAEQSEADMTWTFTVDINDGFGEEVSCTFDLEVSLGFIITIQKTGEEPDLVYQGHYTDLPITMESMAEPIGGFDFLLAYDASALTFVDADLGTELSCWEYFTYRNGPFGNCSGACPSGMVRVVGMRETNDGPNHPEGCYGEDGEMTAGATIFTLRFFVTDDRTYECQFIPVYFFFLDCPDNTVSNVDGNNLYIGDKVYPFGSLTPLDPGGDITDNMNVYGAFTRCEQPVEGKPFPLRNIFFYNGGVDIACADQIDDRGDINLNNIANEIADAVLYTNYFIEGPNVFSTDYRTRQAQIAASDVNNDGRVLTVGDLVYLIRILTGDAVAFDKLSPFASDATVRMSGSTVSLESGVDVGGALFVFNGEADVTLLANGMEMVSDVVDGQTRALVYGNFTNPSSIKAGVSNVLQINGEATLAEVELSDYYGNMLNADVVTKVVPKAYALLQNYPNPFNPTTEVAFDLPESANWTLDVYNIAGQKVKSFSGYSDAGTVKVNVDANGWASGIYFYRLQANNFMATKKMVLMK